MSNELILIVDDNKDVRTFVRTALEVEGYQVVESVDGTDALNKFQSNNPAVVILDLSMGYPDGFEVCREIRRNSTVPLIMLTDRGEELDEAMCLAAGADDFITKPVSPRILALRVSTQIRHSRSEKSQRLGMLTAGGLTLNLETRQVHFDDGQVAVTRTEFDFLKLLMEHPRKVFTREEVISAIGGMADFSNDHFLDTHASRLRLKIKSAGGPKVISAVRGVGYRLIATHDKTEAINAS
jgi:two-component system, OmpR family, response regulator ResD